MKIFQGENFQISGSCCQVRHQSLGVKYNLTLSSAEGQKLQPTNYMYIYMYMIYMYKGLFLTSFGAVKSIHKF